MRMLALLLVVAMTQTPTLAWTQACPAPSNPVRALLHFSVGIADGNTCTVQELGGALVNNDSPAHFWLRNVE
jgi:hypothetical protein